MPACDLSTVLVITESHITGIVICRIVERLGLKSSAEKPPCLPQVFDLKRPFLIILDGGADGHACDDILTDLMARRAAASRLPRIIMLSTSNLVPSLSAGHAAIVDRFVSKPITPDVLQPQILFQLAAARATAQGPSSHGSG